MRIWQCVDGHPVCEGCRDKLDTRYIYLLFSIVW